MMLKVSAECSGSINQSKNTKRCWIKIYPLSRPICQLVAKELAGLFFKCNSKF